MDCEETIAEINALLDTISADEVPVIATENKYTDGLEDAAYFSHKIESNKLLTRGSQWAELDKRLNRKDITVISKQQPSAFFGTELSTILTYTDRDTVVVTGLTTSGCVRATVVDACSHGYRTIVPEECVADRHEESHEASLFDMDTKYADVLDVVEVKDVLKDGIQA